MIVARLENERLRIVDRLRETVRLGAGLDDTLHLAADTQARALACLARFAQRLRDIPRQNIRATGTNTLRRAVNAQDFLIQAEAVLGHPIDIILGLEEARLIYLGVTQHLPPTPHRRLVIDIGGGSSELIVGHNTQPLYMESLSLGCVALTQRHFADGTIRKRALEKALLECAIELEPVVDTFQRYGWGEVIASSGTAKAIAKVVAAQGWNAPGITTADLRKLRDVLLEAGHYERFPFSELSNDRAPVFAAGVIILTAITEALGIKHVQITEAALREGLLYDLLQRARHDDIREITVQHLMVRYHADAAQALRVSQTVSALGSAAQNVWDLSEIDLATLHRAARLHEIGLAVSHNQYHKHGAYLIEQGDLPGFTRHEQRLIAALIRNQRRKLPKEWGADLPPAVRDTALRLCVLLRLAVLLHRARTADPLPALQLRAEKCTLTLLLPTAWLEAHPLTQAELDQEAEYLKEIGFTLRNK